MCLNVTIDFPSQSWNYLCENEKCRNNFHSINTLTNIKTSKFPEIWETKSSKYINNFKPKQLECFGRTCRILSDFTIKLTLIISFWNLSADFLEGNVSMGIRNYASQNYFYIKIFAEFLIESRFYNFLGCLSYFFRHSCSAIFEREGVFNICRFELYFHILLRPI